MVIFNILARRLANMAINKNTFFQINPYLRAEREKIWNGTPHVFSLVAQRISKNIARIQHLQPLKIKKKKNFRGFLKIKCLTPLFHIGDLEYVINI